MFITASGTRVPLVAVRIVYFGTRSCSSPTLIVLYSNVPVNPCDPDAVFGLLVVSQWVTVKLQAESELLVSGCISLV